MKPQPGLALGGRYRLVRQIAVGGMGEVWVAKDESLARDIAVKVLKEEFVGNRDFLNRFRVEARNAASLSHAHIAQLYDYGEQDGAAYLVMELVHGEPMSDLLEREPVLPLPKLLTILSQTSRALHAAHVGGVVHRDIKPGNIIIEHSGDVKITDFGVSLAANQVPMTAAGMVMGTAQYLSPEQAVGQPATGVSDIYALGIVAYEAIAGNRPFTGKTPVDIAVAHVNQPVPPLPKNTNAELSSLVMRMLAKDPLERPRSGAGLAHTFETLAQKISENPWNLGSRTTPAAPVSEALAAAKSLPMEDTGPRIARASRATHGGAPQAGPPQSRSEVQQRARAAEPAASQHAQPSRSGPSHHAQGVPQNAPRSQAAPQQAAPTPPASSARSAAAGPYANYPNRGAQQGASLQGGQPPIPSSGQNVGQGGRVRAQGSVKPLGATPTPQQRASSQASGQRRAPSPQPNSHGDSHANGYALNRAQNGGDLQVNQQFGAGDASRGAGLGTRREVVSPPAPQGLVDRVKSLGWFTLALVAVIGVVLLATGIKALISADGGLGAPAPVNMSNSSVQFISAPRFGERSGTAPQRSRKHGGRCPDS